jgi:hypothetical protein
MWIRIESLVRQARGRQRIVQESVRPRRAGARTAMTRSWSDEEGVTVGAGVGVGDGRDAGVRVGSRVGVGETVAVDVADGV